MGFAKNTKVTMADGTSRNIEDIRTGDLIMGVDKQLTVTSSICGHDENLLQIEIDAFENVSLLKLLPDSVVMTAAGTKRAEQIVRGDSLQCIEDRFATVRDVKVIAYNDLVYHLCFDQNDIFFANGVAVGSMLEELADTRLAALAAQRLLKMDSPLYSQEYIVRESGITPDDLKNISVDFE
ncbi:MAG: hypothetical protein RSA17_09450 [Ruthenibacterium sp.]